MFAPLFPRLKEGILRDVFIQKADVAWDNAPSNRIVVSLLLPRPMKADQWLHDVRTSRNMWPLQKTSHVMASFSMRIRKNLGGWKILKGPHVHWIRQQWERSRAWFAGQAAAQSPSQWVSTLYLHRLDQIDALSWQWLDYHENLVEQVCGFLGVISSWLLDGSFLFLFLVRE